MESSRNKMKGEWLNLTASFADPLLSLKHGDGVERFHTASTRLCKSQQLA